MMRIKIMRKKFNRYKLKCKFDLYSDVYSDVNNLILKKSLFSFKKLDKEIRSDEFEVYRFF